ncbi:hypothetical protein A2U01_0014339, partial [Trifolium medium]|nr:hypothetical protein [Trifolium medium]
FVLVSFVHWYLVVTRFRPSLLRTLVSGCNRSVQAKRSVLAFKRLTRLASIVVGRMSPILTIFIGLSSNCEKVGIGFQTSAKLASIVVGRLTPILTIFIGLSSNCMVINSSSRVDLLNFILVSSGSESIFFPSCQMGSSGRALKSASSIGPGVRVFIVLDSFAA